MPIVLVGLSHHTAPVQVRERLAFPAPIVPGALEALRQRGLAREAVIVSTCNRVELYAAVEDPQPAILESIERFLVDFRGCPERLDGVFYARTEPQSIEHLFRVACGLDSMILGETEVLGQLKQAYQLALEHGFTGGRLNRAFQRAFQVAKLVRTQTNIQRGNVSVASAAVDLAEKIFSSIADRRIMVIGAGDTGEKTARALIGRGAAALVVSNRTWENAQDLARQLGGRAVPFDQWEPELARVDIVISSTSAPHYILDRGRLEPVMPIRRNEPLLLIDIAVPRDIEPEVNSLDNVYLYNIDDLQGIADESLRQRQEEVARCEHIIRQKVESLLSSPSGSLSRTGSPRPPPTPDK
ncbi:MAG TPA: glutamyl-tRNA reductase [Candidatus Paceibacterota bacterium]|nr:glutamyl-tRNA reductase [Verrucomicrobiota bacterium]HRZ46646.1 glutamyl-tRNA reductase [Candidatus Paceibacterota bacterium]HRZ91294.1 glutamyl-tRNA reductase [Candidatus Paceibacterota bacterium]